MEQIVVEKRGRWNSHHWTQRVLSLSTLLGVATLSQRGHADQCHRKCIHVSTVQMWPHFAAKHLHENLNSMEAKLTLRVKGVAVKLGERLVHREGEDGMPQHVYRYTQRNCGGDARFWMLRFATFADLEKAVHLFQSVKVVSHFSTSGMSATPATASYEWEAPVKGFKQQGEGHAAGAEEERDTVAAETAGDNVDCHRDGHMSCAADAAALRDELPESADVTPVSPSSSSSLMEGDVAGDLQSIRSQWEQLHPTPAAVLAA